MTNPADPTRSTDPMRTPGGQRQCVARKRDGSRCGAIAVTGTTVCRMHGGSAPQVRRAAKLRLLDLVDPAIATLAREMTNQDARPADRIRAAEAVLDRAGHPRQMQVTAGDAREQLKQRLLQALAERAADAEADLVGEARQIVEGHAEPLPDSPPTPDADEENP